MFIEVFGENDSLLHLLYVIAMNKKALVRLSRLLLSPTFTVLAIMQREAVVHGNRVTWTIRWRCAPKIRMPKKNRCLWDFTHNLGADNLEQGQRCY